MGKKKSEVKKRSLPPPPPSSGLFVTDSKDTCRNKSEMSNHHCILLLWFVSVYATTAANPSESSYACYFDGKRGVYLGDVYSVKWMENSDAVCVIAPMDVQVIQWLGPGWSCLNPRGDSLAAPYVPLRVFSQKGSTAWAFMLLIRVLSPNKIRQEVFYNQLSLNFVSE